MPRAKIPERFTGVQLRQQVAAATREAQGAVDVIEERVVVVETATDGLDVAAIDAKLTEYETRIDALENP